VRGVRRHVWIHHRRSSTHWDLVTRHHHVWLRMLRELTWMRRNVRHLMRRTRWVHSHRLLHHALRTAHHHVRKLRLVDMRHSSWNPLLGWILVALNHVLSWRHGAIGVIWHHGLARKLLSISEVSRLVWHALGNFVLILVS
jgi:hypothetical protein